MLRTSTISILASPMRERSRVHLPRLIRSPYLLLFLTLCGVYAYTPPRWQDWNQNSRIDLTMAIVDQQTVRIDSYVSNTGDYATIGSHAYSDKAPGLSLLAVPVYLAVKATGPLGLTAAIDRLSATSAVTATLNPDGRGMNENTAERRSRPLPRHAHLRRNSGSTHQSPGGGVRRAIVRLPHFRNCCRPHHRTGEPHL